MAEYPNNSPQRKGERILPHRKSGKEAGKGGDRSGQDPEEE